MFRVLQSYKGQFGPIHIIEDDETRRLSINDQIQGRAFISPGAEVVDITLRGPGPVAQSSYTYGWLLAGVHKPFGSGVMIGLGSGIGAIQLLYNFPKIDLTIIEIDPAIVEAALKWFPLLQYYIEKGRLNIIIGDANRELLTLDSEFDYGFCDAYTGADYNCVSDYFNILACKCSSLFLNIIDTSQGGVILKTLRYFQSIGCPMKYVMKSQLPQYTNYDVFQGNWVMTSAPLSMPDLDAFIPHAALTGLAADFGRTVWNNMISAPMVLNRSIDV